jgi:hypothetical protein
MGKGNSEKLLLKREKLVRRIVPATKLGAKAIKREAFRLL